jgi:hypothetical protein
LNNDPAGTIENPVLCLRIAGISGKNPNFACGIVKYYTKGRLRDPFVNLRGEFIKLSFFPV